MFRTPSCLLASGVEPRVTHGHSTTGYVQIGSLTKVVTGTALMRMAEAGLLSVDDPIERWLDTPPGSGITLLQLAEHTSGLPRQPPGLPRKNPYSGFDQAALDALLAGLGEMTTTPPGATEEYSNLGYALLGSALSVAAGIPYEELVHTYVLKPLGIEEMTAYPPAEQRLLATTSLLNRPRKPWTMDGAILPAGGLWATPRAAAQLLTGLLVDKLLGPPAPTWQKTGAVTWHNGATEGASIFAATLPDGRWTLLHRLGGSPDTTDLMGGKALAASRL
ncbi:serine hydrolase domain-containing protein [Streptomyces sp. ISL-96]|uniref:serine hydrolase domain-containing protein n=1 Tax=Streptomyces sp. ISL-96 TaxID=2819191 RepID=UPI0027E3155C|nr:serine hydrolase domain-containing protein [Streptomyces sp. ISL-96]